MEKVSRANLPTLVRQVIARLPAQKNTAALIALRGELGAGKTTFVQALAKELGITETVQSPTYVLMKRYKTTNPKFETLIHIDAYRLSSTKEFAALKPESFLQDPRALVVIEWPERVEGALPAPDIVIKFSSQDADEGERYIETA